MDRMDFFFELGNKYASKSDWKDFALTKLCLCAMGIMIGANIPKKYRKNAMIAAGGMFAATYVPLMIKTLAIAKEMKDEDEESISD